MWIYLGNGEKSPFFSFQDAFFALAMAKNRGFFILRAFCEIEMEGINSKVAILRSKVASFSDGGIFI